MLDQIIGSGCIVDVMGLFVLIEVLALLACWAFWRRGVPPLSLIVNIGAGGSLMLALRAALTGASSATLAACLLASLAFHLGDLGLRWRRR